MAHEEPTETICKPSGSAGSWYVPFVGRGWISIAVCCLGAACQRKLDVGTDILWSADHESGDLSQWAAPGAWSGGVYLASADASVAISTEQAHSGQYSVKLSTPASNDTPSPTGGGGLFKEGIFSKDAYYSVWYFLPRAYTTTTSWTVLKFRSRYSATVISEVLDIRLQSLPSGEPSSSSTHATPISNLRCRIRRQSCRSGGGSNSRPFIATWATRRDG